MSSIPRICFKWAHHNDLLSLVYFSGKSCTAPICALIYWDL